MRTESVPLKLGFGVNDPLPKKVRNSVPKKSIATPIHVLCSNITEIGRREMGETMRCFADKNFRKMRFFATILRPFRRGRQKFTGEHAREPTSRCKISFQSVPVCRSYFRKMISYDRNKCLWHIITAFCLR